MLSQYGNLDISLDGYNKIVMKTKHIKKLFKFLIDTSAIQLSKKHVFNYGVGDLNTIKIFLDSLYCKIRYRISSKEYFYFSFFNLSSHARKTFIGDIESTYNQAFRINKGSKELFTDKYLTYNAYKSYFRRDLICLSLPSSNLQFWDFALSHDAIIIKPVSSKQGKGIRIVEWKKEDREEEVESVLEDLSKDGEKKYVIEELIHQHPLMASFHPQSVNTIRYVVSYINGKVIKLFAIIRIGVGNSRVDNTHAGGICAAIDLDSGLIITEGVRHNGERFYFHPDTGAQIIGTQIPKWDELSKMVEELAPKSSPIRLVGWDFALSQKGWCIVEGNPCPSTMGIQGSTGIGYKKRFMEIVKMCNNKHV